MAMNDEETVALIVGGHTFGKCHGAGDADYVGPEPEGCPVEAAGLRLAEHRRHRQGRRHDHQRARGRLDQRADQVGQRVPRQPVRLRLGADESPAGAKQWTPTNPAAQDTVPDAHDPSKRHAPMMLTTDLALKLDPIYGPIAKRFHENPDQLADAFAKAWYKLLHRDMGPVSRYLGPWVPEPQLWQDPVPAVDHDLIGDADIAALKGKILARDCPISQLVSHRVGVGGQLPRHRQAGRGQRGPDPPRTAEGLGGQRPGRAGQGAADPRADPAGLQRLAVRREEGLPRRPDRPGRVRGRRAGGEERRARRHGSVRTRAHGRLAGADRRRVVRRARTDRRRVPQLPPRRREAAAGDAAAGSGQPVDADRSRDDGARRRPAGAERQLRAVRSTASSPTGPRR